MNPRRGLRRRILLDDLWNDEKLICLPRRIGKRLRGRKPISRLVIPKNVEDRVGVRRRLDSGDIDLFQLFHVLEDLGKLLLKRGDFFFAKLQACQLRGVANIKIGAHKAG